MSKYALTVDDSVTMREMVAFTLRNAGFDVLEAGDGEDAIETLKSADNKVNIIITDLNMPKMDGVSLIRKLRADPNYKTTPILMLTTEGDSTSKDQGREAGATGWIVKPFNPEKLLNVISRVLS